LRQLCQHIAHAATRRADAKFVTVTLDLKFYVIGAVSELRRNADSLGVVVSE
jgi:hypothetical protein